MPLPDRRAEVLAIAAELFARKGVPGTSMRDLGEATGLHPGSLYHYFRSKEELIGTILDQLMSDVQARFAAAAAHSHTPLERITNLIRVTLSVIDTHPHATAIYQNDRRYLRDRQMLVQIDEASRRIRHYWLDALAEGASDGSIRADVPGIFIYRTIRDALWASARWPERADHDPGEFTEWMCRLLLAGIVPADPAAAADVAGYRGVPS